MPTNPKLVVLYTGNNFRNMNMCFLQAAMCEISIVGGGSKKFEDWGVTFAEKKSNPPDKKFRDTGGYFCWGGGQYPITCHVTDAI